MAQTSRAYGFVDWSGDSGLKFAAASSQYLCVCFVSSDDYGQLRDGLMHLRGQCGLPQHFEFHFAHCPNRVKEAFFGALLLLRWDAAALLVDKRSLARDLAKMPEPSFYGFFVADLIARMPLATLQVRRILVDDQKKPSVLARAIRIAISPVLRARNIERAPKVRGEPSHQCDGLQVADMLAGTIVAREKTRNDYARRLDRLVVYRYEAQQ
jgi:hypothetical protein